METLEYSLDEEEKRLNLDKKWPSQVKIIIGLLIGFIILLIIGFIIYAIKKESDIDDLKDKNNRNKDNNENNENNKNINTNYSIKYANLSYTDQKIINSFKKTGSNYNETMGEINSGEDYNKTDRNIYDLYIPYTSPEKKNDYNYLILLIHGGGWKDGSKEEMEFINELLLLPKGYISASMSYTLINEEYKNFKANIFRILDEITTCIESIIKILAKEGFNIGKLEMAIGGASAGGHLSLLYAYSMKNIPLPLKYIINIVGPVTLDPEHFLKVKEEPLNSIDLQDIEKAKSDGLIERLYTTDIYLIEYMNMFNGLIFNKEELNSMLENNRLNKNNEKYKKMFNYIVNGYPIHFINSDSIPALCVYGGKDEAIGIGHFSYLKSINREYAQKLYILYEKNALHNVFKLDDKPNIDLIGKLENEIDNFSKKYFTSFNK